MMTLVVVCSLLGAQTQSYDAAATLASFASAETPARRDAVRAASIRIAQGDDSVLPLIEMGVADSDPQVRFSAVSGLARWAIVPGAIRALDGDAASRLQAALLTTLADPDFRIRGAAVKVLVAISDSGSEATSALLAMFKRETDAPVRGVIVTELGKRYIALSSVQGLAIEALQDVSPLVRKSAAGVVRRFRPEAALPLVAAELRSGNHETQAEYVATLRAYGGAAKPYVGILDLLLAGETDNAYRLQLEDAIRAIRNSADRH